MLKYPNQSKRKTAFIMLDTKKCKACWKCQEVCTHNVIGRVNMPWHKHALIKAGNNCTGCLKCVDICESNAVYQISAKN